MGTLTKLISITNRKNSSIEKQPSGYMQNLSPAGAGLETEKSDTIS